MKIALVNFDIDKYLSELGIMEEDALAVDS